MPVSKPVLAGNWKMNVGPDDAREFFRTFLVNHPRDAAGTVIFFPPALSLAASREALGDRNDVRLGVQNVYWEESGAFTGEISAPLARQAGAEYALVGHSERRHLFGESLYDTSKKVASVLAAGLRPVLCVGETIEERRGGRAEAIVVEQLAAVLDTLPTGRIDALLIAYEPVWAIGTGETASASDASAMHGAIRTDLRRRYGSERAESVPILYGGSVKPGNAAELLTAPEIDGVLVGGASLDPEGFARICAAGS